MLTVCSGSQGILLCPQTLSQARRERLRRAFTDATSDTVSYVKTVGVDVHRPSLLVHFHTRSTALETHLRLVTWSSTNSNPLRCYRLTNPTTSLTATTGPPDPTHLCGGKRERVEFKARAKKREG
ncbi:hypothetical protein FOCC_FOCC013014 [Frankliniella occidentalis]|nr:hypothetical protein FOCC_FOCC013014 [Frankliniella occidentalis]